MPADARSALTADIDDCRTLHVYYNPRHPSAPIKDGRDLFAVLRLTTTEYTAMYRWPLRRLNDSLWTAEFELPQRTVGMFCTVLPHGVYMPMHDVAISAPLTCDGTPVRGGLAWEMWSARTIREADSLFRRDREIYPHDIERWLPYTVGRLESGYGPDPALREFEDGIRTATPEPTANSAPSIAVVRAFCHSAEEKWAAVRVDIDEYGRALIASGRSPSFNEIMALDPLLNRVARERQANRTDGTTYESIRDAIAAIAVAHRNSMLASMLFRSALVVSDGNNAKASGLDVLADSLIFWVRHPDGAQIITLGGDIVLNAVIYLRERRRFADVIELVDASRTCWDQVPEWTGSSPAQMVSFSPWGGQRLSAEVAAAKSTFETGRRPQAIQRIKDAIPRYSSAFQSMRASAFMSMASMYLRSDSIDSACKYMLVASDLGAPSEHFRPTLDSAIRARGAGTFDEADARKRFGLTVAMGIRIHNATVTTTDGRVIDLTASGTRNTLIVFTSSTCGSCHEAVRKLMDSLATLKPEQYHLLFIIPHGDRIETRAGTQSSVAYYGQELNQTFTVGGYPAAFLVRDGLILKRWDELSPSSIQAVIRALRSNAPIR